MNSAAPSLSPLFRSDMQGEILARIFLNPDRSFTISDLARAAQSPYASVHREVTRLLQMGVVHGEKHGQALEISARVDSPVFAPLSELLRLSYGPTAVLPAMLSGIEGIVDAYIYGSWAARRLGEPGSPPGDVDLLVIGNPTRSEVYEAAQHAGSILAREVNVRVISAEAWKSTSDDPFLQTIKERPLVQLDLQEIAA
jgi:predicted nucleotidyltransferase